jgi:hypothetical protein
MHISYYMADGKWILNPNHNIRWTNQPVVSIQRAIRLNPHRLYTLQAYLMVWEHQPPKAGVGHGPDQWEHITPGRWCVDFEVMIMDVNYVVHKERSFKTGYEAFSFASFLIWATHRMPAWAWWKLKRDFRPQAILT